MLNKKQQRLRRSRQTRIRIAKQNVARLTVNRTNLHIYASVISDCGTKVLASASTTGKNVLPRLAALVVDSSEHLRDREESSLEHLLAGSRLLVKAVSHEIRNVCGAIGVIYANLVESGSVRGNQDLEALGSLVDALKKIAALDLKDSGESIQAGPIDLHDVLGDLRIVLEPPCREEGVELSHGKWDKEKKEWVFEGDGIRVMPFGQEATSMHPALEKLEGWLVNEQIRVAAGAPLSVRQEDVRVEGHAIECRINAEHPATFRPSPGTITYFHPPGGLGVRVDSAAFQGYRIPPHYDSLMGKLIVHGRTRNECLMRLRRSLEEFVIGGIETTIPLHQRIIRQQNFIDGEYDIHWLEKLVGLKK